MMGLYRLMFLILDDVYNYSYIYIYRYIFYWSLSIMYRNIDRLF